LKTTANFNVDPIRMTSTSGEASTVHKLQSRRNNNNLGPLGALGNMDPGAIVSKMSSISNFTNSLNGPLISSSPNYQFPKVNVFNM
jgi:hypothetical protein